MNMELPILCIFPDKVYVQPDWTIYGFAAGVPRKLQACLLSIYEFQNKHPKRIVDWKAAKEECRIMVEPCITFNQLKSILCSLVPQKPGAFVYSATVLDGIGDNSINLKHSRREPMYAGDYVAHITKSRDGLSGYDPDVGNNGIPFTLGWFPDYDPIMSKISTEYASWPGSEIGSFLPVGPSPSVSSIELTSIKDDDVGIIGLFTNYPDSQASLALQLRHTLSEDVVVTSLNVDDFWDWLNSDLCLDDLITINKSPLF